MLTFLIRNRDFSQIISDLELYAISKRVKLKTIDQNSLTFKKNNYRFPSTQGTFILEPYQDNFLLKIQFLRKNIYLTIIPIFLIIYTAFGFLLYNIFINALDPISQKTWFVLIFIPFLPIRRIILNF